MRDRVVDHIGATFELGYSRDMPSKICHSCRARRSNCWPATINSSSSIVCSRVLPACQLARPKQKVCRRRHILQASLSYDKMKATHLVLSLQQTTDYSRKVPYKRPAAEATFFKQAYCRIKETNTPRSLYNILRIILGRFPIYLLPLKVHSSNKLILQNKWNQHASFSLTTNSRIILGRFPYLQQSSPFTRPPNISISI